MSNASLKFCWQWQILLNLILSEIRMIWKWSNLIIAVAINEMTFYQRQQTQIINLVNCGARAAATECVKVTQCLWTQEPGKCEIQIVGGAVLWVNVITKKSRRSSKCWSGPITATIMSKSMQVMVSRENHIKDIFTAT